ncbi:MAG: hypothetical protein ACOCYO_11505, partial [Bacteroidota bacterium]
AFVITPIIILVCVLCLIMDVSSVYNFINSVRWSSPKLRFCVFARATKSNHLRVFQNICHGSVQLLLMPVKIYSVF